MYICEDCKSSKRVVFDFGEAIRRAKAGRRVARSSWDVKGKWIAIMPSLYLKDGIVTNNTQKFIEDEPGLDSNPYFVMWTSMKQWQPGWLATQSDMLAEDWTEITSRDELIKNEKLKEI